MFAVSGLHNVVHLAFGIVGFMFARTYAASRAYLLVGGLGYLALWVDGCSSTTAVRRTSCR